MPTPEPNDPSERLRALLEKCLDRIAADGEVAAEPLLAAHPDVAEVLRARLAKLRVSGLLPIAEDDGIPRRLGDFRLLRRLGAGGMGVVYVAEQESLRRQVALKVVRPELLLFPGARERFRREVETIARLDDPGIVPIHFVGEDRGVPYFAMALVEGASLAQVLTALRGKRADELDGSAIATVVAKQLGVEGPEPLPDSLRGSWYRTCAALMQQMAEAVQHAHDNGVIHRDLKPSNAMITAGGRVVLLDFGLAAPQDAARITRSGAQLGTLQYMAPEQIRGTAVDVRTDVYALGVTFHEMLALNCPFDGETADSVRSAILSGAQPLLRKDNPGVPRDLETICRKAMDLDPARRYATALAFAEDLGRFLEHRTIEARRAGPLLRASRLLRRHPAVGAVLASLPVLLGGTLVAIERVRVELQSEVVSVRSANEKLEESASTSLESALEAIAALARQARDPTLLKTPGLDSMRAQQVEQVVALLRRIRAEPSPSPVIRRSYARGLMIAAEVWRALGNNAAALPALVEAERELRAPELVDGELVSDKLDLAAVMATLGHVYRERGDVDQTFALWNQAIDRLEPLASAAQAMPRALALLAATLTDRGLLRQSQGHIAEAEADYVRALELGRRAAQTGDERELPLALLRTRSNHAGLLQATGRIRESCQDFAAMAIDAKRLVDLDPADPEPRRELARANAGLARAAQQLGDPETAGTAMTASLEAFAALARDFPQRAQYRWESGMAELSAAAFASQEHDFGAARSHYERAILSHGILRKLAPDRIDTGRELAVMHGNLALLLEREGAIDDARAESDRTIAIQHEVMESPRADSRDRRDLGRSHYNRALQRRKAGDVDGVLADLEVAIPLLQAPRDPDEPPLDPAVLQGAYRALGECHAARHDPGAAIAALARMQDLAPMDRATLRALGTALELDTREDFEALLARAADK